MKSPLLWFSLAVLVLATGLAAAQSAVFDRVRSAFEAGDYEAAAQVAQSDARGASASDLDLRWQQARLETDPDRFDRQALDVVTDASTLRPELARVATLERAREQFARGRYRTAAELLSPLVGSASEAADEASAEVRLWLGMSEQAAGQAGAARRHFAAIAKAAPQHGLAQALLADLALRGGRLEAAEVHARRALDNDASAGAIALSVLERAYRSRGDEDAANAMASRLRQEFPRSTEASWVSAGPTIDTDDANEGIDSPVLDAGDRRTFSLQFGAFRDRSLALKMADQMKGIIEPLRVEVDRSEDTVWYRVLGGRYVTRSQAEVAQKRFEGEGLSCMVLAPARGD